MNNSIMLDFVLRRTRQRASENYTSYAKSRLNVFVMLLKKKKF